MAVAVEHFVKTQLKEISAISSLVSDFTVAHERYAHEYAKLPVASSPVLSSPTGSDDLAMPSGLERILDIAQSVMDAVVQANLMIAQELQIEEGMIKRIQAMLKAHSTGTIGDVFAPGPTPADSTALSDFLSTHKQLKSNLADPICRTLRFSQSSTVSVTNVKAKAEASGMEREVSDLRDYLAVIKRNEATQRADTIKTLGHTSLVGVKTMELMVNDHVKNLMKALGILSEAVANCQRRVQVRAARVADSTAAGVDMSPLTVAFEDDADIIGAALGESEGQLAGAKESPDDGKRGLTNTEAPEQIDNEVGNNAAEMIEDQVNRTDHVVRSKSHETNRGVIYQAFKRKMPTDCAT
ncbi:hypothetical protein ATCC90586_003930 [Pythium insidiosum]|nr:hypothetical protein ATCC90586_003930 [Pythium insidiosum]